MFTFTEVEKAHTGFDVGISDVLRPLVPVTLLRLCFGNIVFILSFWDNLSLPPPFPYVAPKHSFLKYKGGQWNMYEYVLCPLRLRKTTAVH